MSQPHLIWAQMLEFVLFADSYMKHFYIILGSDFMIVRSSDTGFSEHSHVYSPFETVSNDLVNLK